MNRLSGRLPMASTRRLSASISSSQRPHSSYSLNMNPNCAQQLDEITKMSIVQQHKQPNIHINQPVIQSTNSCYFDHTITPEHLIYKNSPSSLLISKKDNSVSPNEMVVFGDQISLSSPTPILNYADHSNYTLQAKQQQQRTSIFQKKNEVSKQNCPSYNPKVMAPISITTTNLITTSSITDEINQNKVLSVNEPGPNILQENSNFMFILIFFVENFKFK